MTDKQIIIDGVDVSGCEFLIIEKDKQMCRCIKADLFGGIEFVENAKNGNCQDNPNCYYKQLKAKEQECEKIKEDNATLFDKAIEARKECTDLKEQLFLLQIDYTELEKRHNDSFEQFNQLKTELDQMTALKDTYFACYHAKHEDLAKKYDQLKAENEELKKQLKFEFDETLLQYSNELDRLKAENEELKRDNASLYIIIDGKNGTIGCFKDRVDELKEEKQALIKDWEEKKNLAYEIACKNEKLKQTLTEIKKIASKVLLNTHDLEQFKDADALFGALLEIHKKISEVEDGSNTYL